MFSYIWDYIHIGFDLLLLPNYNQLFYKVKVNYFDNYNRMEVVSQGLIKETIWNLGLGYQGKLWITYLNGEPFVLMAFLCLS